jgi:hypothetical protein
MNPAIYQQWKQQQAERLLLERIRVARMPPAAPEPQPDSPDEIPEEIPDEIPGKSSKKPK